MCFGNKSQDNKRQEMKSEDDIKLRVYCVKKML